jgi:hypothetical protein
MALSRAFLSAASPNQREATRIEEQPGRDFKN